MNEALIERIGWTLVHFVWQGAIVAIFHAIFMRLLRSKGAEVRYGVAAITLAALASLPIITFIALAPAAFASASGGYSIVSHAVSQGPVETPADAIERYFPTVVIVWACSALAMAARLIGGLLLIERLKRRLSTPASSELRAKVDALAHYIGLRRPIDIRESTKVVTPSAMGVFRAVIIIPTSLITMLPADQLDAVLLHELAHIRRHDYAVNLVQNLIETLFFYHPAVWWISGCVRAEREHCCDDLAVRSLGDPITYVRALATLEVARHPVPLPVMSASGGNLMNRISRICGVTAPTSRPTSVWTAVAATCIAGSVLFGVVEAGAQAAKPTVTKHTASTKLKKSKKKSVGAKKTVAKPLAAKIVGTKPVVAPVAGLPMAAGAKIAGANPPGVSIPAQATGAAPAMTLGGRLPGVSATGGPGGVAPYPSTPLVASPASSPVTPGEPVDNVKRAATVDVPVAQGGTSVVDGDSNRISVFGSAAEFETITLQFAKISGMSVVIGPGKYRTLNISLKNVDIAQAFQALMVGGDARFQVDGGVYYIYPKDSK